VLKFCRHTSQSPDKLVVIAQKVVAICRQQAQSNISEVIFRNSRKESLRVFFVHSNLIPLVSILNAETRWGVCQRLCRPILDYGDHMTNIVASLV